MIIVSEYRLLSQDLPMAKVVWKCPFCAQTASVKDMVRGVQGTNIVTTVRHVAAAFRSTYTAPVSPA
ncbi:hypothetical protein KCP69_20185 [Salmonella enterica subsp. enterica]|nr:hypothetical protein KCP69_20185 [Salmonella enterica subsp. enterica]